MWNSLIFLRYSLIIFINYAPLALGVLRSKLNQLHDVYVAVIFVIWRMSMLQFILISVWQYVHVFLNYLLNWWILFLLFFFKLTTPFCLKNFSALALACSLHPSKEHLRNLIFREDLKTGICMKDYSFPAGVRTECIVWKHMIISAPTEYLSVIWN